MLAFLSSLLNAVWETTVHCLGHWTMSLHRIQDVAIYILDSFATRISFWINHYWPRVEPYYDITKSVLFKSIIAFVVVSSCLYFSAFLFGIVYYYNMPTIYHSFNLHFQYDRRCIQEHRHFVNHGRTSIYGDHCYPKTDLSFDLGSKKLVDPKQLYRVYLSLEVPESPTNLDIGMFMVKMKYHQMEASYPASLRYRPLLTRVSYMLAFWPLYLFGFLETTQTLNIPLFDEVAFCLPTEDEIKACERTKAERDVEACERTTAERDVETHKPTRRERGFFKNKLEHREACQLRIANVWIDYPDIQIYSARLHLTATFSGLQHFFFQWPVFSFVVGTTIFFVPVLSSALVMIYLAWWVVFRADTTALLQNFAARDTRPRIVRDEVPREAPGAEDVDGDGNDDNDSQNSSAATSSIVMIGSSSLENMSVGEHFENPDSCVLPRVGESGGALPESGVAQEEPTVRRRK